MYARRPQKACREERQCMNMPRDIALIHVGTTHRHLINKMGDFPGGESEKSLTGILQSRRISKLKLRVSCWAPQWYEAFRRLHQHLSVCSRIEASMMREEMLRHQRPRTVLLTSTGMHRFSLRSMSVWSVPFRVLP